MKHTTAIAAMLVVGSFFAQNPPQGEKPLGDVELLALWIDGISSVQLAKSVTKRGIDFVPGEDFLHALTVAGAQEDLFAALKGATRAAGESVSSTAPTAEAQVLEHLIRAVQLNTNNWHPEDAEPECRAAIQADAQSAFAHLALGGILLQRRATELAAAEFREALRLRPDLAEAHAGLGSALDGQHQLDAAISEYRQALLLEPDNARVHRGLARSLEGQGDKQGAQEERRLAEQLDPRPSVPQRIRVGGQIMSSRVINAPRPEYPPEAKSEHVEGVVRLMVLIGQDGTIKDLKVLRGDPILVNAAKEAVARWTYPPTLLNGQPVEVVTDIDVNFTL